MSTTKLIKDLKVGDRVGVKDPEGVAEITRVERSRLFQAAGGCFRLDWKIVEGPHKGKRIEDQHHAGDDRIMVTNG